MKQESRRIFPAAVLSILLLIAFLAVDPPLLIIGWSIAVLLGGLSLGIAINSYSLWKKK
jgi:hypothetical protein